jgi:hypothetical protein
MAADHTARRRSPHAGVAQERTMEPKKQPPTTTTITLSIPHRLTRDEARRRVQNALAGLKGQHAAQFAQVEENWTAHHMDFRVAVLGQSLTGRVDVGEEKVDIALDLPWLMAIFADRIRDEVQRKGTKLLE